MNEPVYFTFVIRQEPEESVEELYVRARRYTKMMEEDGAVLAQMHREQPTDLSVTTTDQRHETD